MARVTVEDCVRLIPNRFELSLIAGRRAKDLLLGAPALIDNDKKEKYTVTALREIGKGLINIDSVKKELENEMQDKKVVKHKNDKIKKLINTESKIPSDDSISEIKPEEKNIDDDNKEETKDKEETEDKEETKDKDDSKLLDDKQEEEI